MGACGPDPFDNDDACDWIADLCDGGLMHIERTLRTAAAETDYLDAGLGADTVAAADVVARLSRRGGVQSATTEEVDAWVATQSAAPGPKLMRLAVAAIDRVLGTDSELAEIWDEADDDAWRTSVLALRARLTG